MYFSARYSIFYPLLSLRISKIMLSAALIIIGVLPWVLPSEVAREGSGGWLFQMVVECFADAGSMARVSHHPFTIAICYSGAMVLGLVVALVYATTAFATYPFQKIDTASPVRRVGLLVFALSVIALPVFQEMPVSSAHRTYRFFQNVSESKFHIFLWSISMMVLAAMSWVIVFLEISRLLPRSVRSVS